MFAGCAKRSSCFVYVGCAACLLVGCFVGLVRVCLFLCITGVLKPLFSCCAESQLVFGEMWAFSFYGFTEMLPIKARERVLACRLLCL